MPVMRRPSPHRLPQAPSPRPHRIDRLRPMLFAILLASGCGRDRSTPAATTPQNAPPRIPVVMAGESFQLELAMTPAARFQGLSNRASIPADGGMLFVFPTPRPQAFVMRRCLVPIDILFLDENGILLNTHSMEVEPYHQPEAALRRYPSEGPALIAIELAGGTLDRLDLHRGDRIALPIDRLRELAR